MIKTDPVVKMDQCHLDLIYGITVSHKPKKVLELGMGSGIATDRLLQAFRDNDLPLDLTCVDNWLDWNFVKPAEISKYELAGVKVITSPEKDFVFSCREKYNLILSDGDHDHAQDWFAQTFSLLNPGGILIYHDVTNPDFANLYSICTVVKRKKLSHLLFNTSSRSGENCERGLLIIGQGHDFAMPLHATLRSAFRSWFRKLKGVGGASH